MRKKIGAFGAGQFSLGTLAGGRPGTTIFQNPGGGGGLGGVAYKDRARPPPRETPTTLVRHGTCCSWVLQAVCILCRCLLCPPRLAGPGQGRGGGGGSSRIVAHRPIRPLYYAVVVAQKVWAFCRSLYQFNR